MDLLLVKIHLLRNPTADHRWIATVDGRDYLLRGCRALPSVINMGAVMEIDSEGRLQHRLRMWANRFTFNPQKKTAVIA